MNDVSPACPSPWNGTTVTESSNPRIRRTETIANVSSYIGASLRVEADVAAGIPQLLLVPESTSVAPTNRRIPGNPDILGESSTIVRAMLVASPPGTYVTRARIDSFDASAGGHRHGAPPSSYWGKLDEASEATCTIEIPEGMTEGECSITYQADEISGIAKIAASIDDHELETEPTIEVQVGLDLTDISSFLVRPGERLRRPDTDHVDSDAFFVRPDVVPRVQDLSAKFEAITKSQDLAEKLCPDSWESIVRPQGLYLTYNDMSLPRGGQKTPHKGHRKGTSVDINRSFRDGSTGAELGRSACLDALVFAACEKAGGRIEPEGTIHCEFR